MAERYVRAGAGGGSGTLPTPAAEPPPLPDWAALRVLAAEATAEVVTASMATDRATRALQVLENRIREYELAD